MKADANPLTAAAALLIGFLLVIQPMSPAVAGGEDQALHMAVQAGNIVRVRQLLEAGVDPDIADELGDTPLHHAVRGETGLSQLLLDAGANPNARNAGGIAPLLLAAGSGRSDLIERLRQAGARIDIKDYQGSSAGDWALRGGHPDLADRLKQQIAASGRGMQLSDDGTSFADDAYVTAKFPSWFKHSFYDLPDDLQEAREAGKLGIMLFISAKHCSYCQAFLNTSMEDPRLQERLRTHFDVIGMDIFDDSEMVAINGSEYRVKEFVLKARASHTPTLMFFGKGGRLLARIVGYYPPQRFAVLLDYLESGASAGQGFRDYLAEQQKPHQTHGRFIRDALMEQPPYQLDRTRSSADRPLMVLFDRPDCEACARFHRRVLGDKSIRRLLGSFDRVQLDAGDDTGKLVKPDGGISTARAWYEQLDLSYSPAVVIFDQQGAEILRLDSEVLPFRMEGTLQMVLDGATGEVAQLQRWRRDKVIESLRKAGAL